MLDADFILDYLAPRLFAWSILLDMVNAILLPIGKKDILSTIRIRIGNEKEHEEIIKSVCWFGWRYLPIILFMTANAFQSNLGLSLWKTSVGYVFLTAWALVVNRKIFGFNIQNFGAFLNMLVCSLNNGLMPTIYPPSGDYHILMTDDSTLKFLSDWIVSGYSMISIGDILIIAGSAIFLISQACIFIKILIGRIKNSSGGQ